MLTRLQALVLGFFLLVWSILLFLLLVAPEVYAQVLRLPPGEPGRVAAGFWLALTAFLVLLAVGVLRRWRWLFWLLLLAFLAGGLRVPYAALQLSGVLPAEGPPWYSALQGTLGAIQCVIGVSMLRGYQRAGLWAWPTT
jgi:hypothetical protein